MSSGRLMHWARVVSNEVAGSRVFRLTFEAPGIAMGALPGQFVHVKCARGLDPFLRRPFSIHSIDKASGLVSILVQVVGKGTAMLSEVKSGEKLDVIGPLGRGFTPPERGEALLVGGGLGVAPLVFLGQYLSELGIGGAALIGAATARMVFGARELEGMGFEVSVSTEDGSLGRGGLVTELLRDYLEGQRRRFGKAFMVGPVGMLRSSVNIVKDFGLPAEVSLEERMACGVGACLGCAVRVRRPPVDGGCQPDATPQGYSEFTYARVCKDGPVFDAGEVILDE